jgi:hypothetical protein
MWVTPAQPFELTPRCNLESHHFDELWIMALQDREQIGDFTIQVVGDLCFWAPFSAQEHSPHTDKRLNIRSVIDRLDRLDDGTMQGFLSAQPRGDAGDICS